MYITKVALNTINRQNSLMNFGRNKIQNEHNNEYYNNQYSLLNNSASQIALVSFGKKQVQRTDYAYRSDLLKFIGEPAINSSRISSILGPNETKEILTELSKDKQNFVPSPENVESGQFKANLHMHTNASDGEYTVKKLLEDSAQYANHVFQKTGKPFVIAITDHDTISTYRAAIKEIYANSNKYKNLRVILGMEASSCEVIDNRPIEFHALAYNINPLDPKAQKAIETVKERKFRIGEVILDKANNIYKDMFNGDDLFSIDEMKKYYPPVAKGILGIHGFIRKYVQTKFVIKEIIFKAPELKAYFEKTNPNLDINEEMQKVNDFFYNKYHGNKIVKPYPAITEYYTTNTGISQEKLNEILDNASENAKNFLNIIAPLLHKETNIETPKGNENILVTCDELYSMFSNQPHVILGVAHPIHIQKVKSKVDGCKNVLFKPVRKPKLPNAVSEPSADLLNKFCQNFVEKCKEKAKIYEAYYQSYNTGNYSEELQAELTPVIESACQTHKLIKTGGLDSHGLSPFSKHRKTDPNIQFSF